VKPLRTIVRVRALPRPPIPPQRKYEVVKLWLVDRLTYEEIRKRTGISVGKISEIVNEFLEKARERSLEEAARIFGVGDEVGVLLDLSKTLREAGIAISEVKEVVGLLRKLSEMGVKVDNVKVWVEFFQRISQPGFPLREFVEAAIKLQNLEKQAGLSYESLISDYEEKLKEIKSMQKNIEVLRREIRDLEEKKKLATKLENRVLKAKQELSRLENMKKFLEEENKKLQNALILGEEAIKTLHAEIDKLSKTVEALETKRKRLEEEIAQKRGELENLSSKVSEMRSQYESLKVKYEDLRVLVNELERLRSKYVNDIARYKMEYEEYMEVLERVSTKLEGVKVGGRDLGVKELRDIIVETLKDEAERIANSILSSWIREGVVVLVGEYTVSFTCPHCSTTFPLKITRDLMAQLVRGHGAIKLGSLVLPRVVPSPGSTTITCPSCRELIEIRYEDVTRELSRTTRRER
jgi:uncharacterized coiled-coil DUF342 family protein